MDHSQFTPLGVRKRRNGDLYYPRDLGGMEDLMFYRKAQHLRQHVLLAGPPGSGKTAGSEAAFDSVPEGEDFTQEMLNQEGLYTIVGDSSTTTDDFVGGYVQRPDGQFEWHHGALINSMINNKPLLVDEIGLIDPKVLSILYPLMDGRGVLEVTQNPSLEPIKLSSSPGWFIIAAYNPDVPGVYLSEALLDRFTHRIEVEADWNLAKELGVPSELVDIVENLNISRRKGEISYSPQMRTLIDFKKTEQDFGFKFAIKNLISKMPEDDRASLIKALKGSPSIVRKVQDDMVPLSLGGVYGGMESTDYFL